MRGDSKFHYDLRSAAMAVGLKSTVGRHVAARWKWTPKREEALKVWCDYAMAVLICVDGDEKEAVKARQGLLLTCRQKPEPAAPFSDALEIVCRYHLGELHNYIDLADLLSGVDEYTREIENDWNEHHEPVSWLNQVQERTRWLLENTYLHFV